MLNQTGVYILSGNRLLCESLARILKKKTDIQVLGAERPKSDTWDEVRSSGAHILLLDSASLILSEAEEIKDLRAHCSDLKFLLIGMEEDEQLFLRVVRRGVVGYVLGSASPLDIVAAVRAVAQGEAVCPPRLCRFMFRYVEQQSTEFPNGQAKLQLSLTRREQQLVPLIARGLTNKEIAVHFNLSEQTVKNHIHRILQKVGAEDRLSALEVCRMQGLTGC